MKGEGRPATPPPGPFSADLDLDGSSAVLKLRGELDMATAPALIDGAATAASILVVDLRDVTFMDSTGLRALWTLRQQTAAAGGRMVLRAPSPHVTRILETTKLDEIFEYVEDGDGQIPT